MDLESYEGGEKYYHLKNKPLGYATILLAGIERPSEQQPDGIRLLRTNRESLLWLLNGQGILEVQNKLLLEGLKLSQTIRGLGYYSVSFSLNGRTEGITKTSIGEVWYETALSYIDCLKDN